MMSFWFFMLFMDFFIPVIMIIVGSMFIKRPPKEINIVLGYRTNMSMKNMETWIFAHNYCGKIWVKIGLILLPFSVLPLLFVWDKSTDDIGLVGGIVCCIQIIPLIISVIYTEIALKKVFDENGNRKKE